MNVRENNEPRQVAGLLGILDVGKTHARFLTADRHGCVLSAQERKNEPGPRLDGVRQLDVTGVEAWLCQIVSGHPERDRIDTLVPIAHGAAAVLVDDQSNIVAAPDYEDSCFDEVADRYRAVRDPFDQSFSPFLPLGLNLGRQLFYLQERLPQVWQRAHSLLLFPQFWAWRMCAVVAAELTALGCHTDLWRPLQNRVTQLTERQGWQGLLPPLRQAHDCLGAVSASFIERTGLRSDCRVLCGLHDSNASFLAHRLLNPMRSFAVISSGTWTIVMVHGSDPKRVRESLDMLLNVEPAGTPVATARFMGGREFEAIAGLEGLRVEAEVEDLDPLLSQEIYALPSFSQAGGPFAGTRGRLTGSGRLSAKTRVALASLYIALMCDHLLDLLGHTGTVIVDGPIARNALFLQLIAELRVADTIVSGANIHYPAAIAAASLSGGDVGRMAYQPVARRGALPKLAGYREKWRAMAHAATNDQ